MKALYWIKYWNSLIHEAIETNYIEDDFYGPRMLIEDIISEIKNHGLNNTDNNIFFRSQLSHFRKQDNAFSNLYGSEIKLLTKYDFQNKNSEFIHETCLKIKHELEQGDYLKKLLNNLKVILESDSDLKETKEIIKYQTKLILSELFSSGINFNDFKIKDYNDKVDFTNNDITNHIINQLNKFLYTDPIDAIVLFRIDGIKGDDDYFIDNINIYNPAKKKLIKSDSGFTYIENEIQDRDYLNAAIHIKHRFPYTTIALARQKISLIINIITLNYNLKNPISIGTNEITIINDKGRVIFQSLNIKGEDPRFRDQKEVYNYHGALNLKDEFSDSVSNKLKEIECIEEKTRIKIEKALHWYHKSQENNNPEDILLFCWFAIEGLLKVDDKTKQTILNDSKKQTTYHYVNEICSAIFAKYLFSEIWKNEYDKQLFNLYTLKNHYHLTNECINKTGLDLKENEKYKIGDFLNNLNSIIEETDDEILKDELEEVKLFYDDIGLLKQKLSKFKNDLLQIYRYRNLMAHNASINNNRIIIYARKISFICELIIQYFITASSENREKTFEELLFQLKIEHEILMENFENEVKTLKYGNK